jgi:hypothetical protein
LCAVAGSKAEKTALMRRTRLLSGLGDQQRRLAGELTSGIGRLCGP